MKPLATILLVLASLGAGMPETPSSPARGWPQWGGPDRNFVAPPADLSTAWPESGPKKIWRRPLGDGFSSIVSDEATLYTIYREGGDDVAIAIDAKTGDTAWSTKYAAPFRETCSEQLGPAPRAAPLIAGARLVTVSAGGLMTSLDRATGKPQWSRNLLEGSPEAVRACGYSSSPLVYRNTIITTAGGKGRGVIALDAATGAVAWQAQDFQNGYSSPLLIDLDGRPELIVFTYGEIAGLDPENGRLEWSRPHKSDQGVNVATPIWGSDHLLFVSSAYGGGSRMLKLARSGDTVTVEELWSSQRVRLHFGNGVRLGDRLYASNGDMASAPFAAIDVVTGEIVWRDRSVTRATLIASGERLILLDEDGNLAIATPTGTGLQVHAKAALLAERAWTAPTLVGTTLYVRDRHQIMALDLGR